MLEHFGLDAPAADLDELARAGRARRRRADERVRIAIVGKYVELEDAYLSVAEALRHAGFRHGCADRDRLGRRRGADRRRAAARGSPTPTAS